MLKLKNITKNYISGDSTVKALKGISIEFRKSEFVAILGHSGCGKTTLLNIIGGLDGYTDGDLIINGRSTKEYSDNDWDRYRNHSIGFVFQSYNLIPHQSILSNVELALTLSGVPKKERRQRAAEVLEKVGLGDLLSKKPNQLSGGQMQRVAIARALVNNPEILLADEATGALDSETSIQIMELLKEISKDRLVIMVTHNPELAEKYATRTVKLKDGLITSDSDAYTGDTQTGGSLKKDKRSKKKTSMSFFTALSLSLNNLMTKKTRTLLTSFAGSIGIIGIALILSVSTGVQKYINRVQEDTLSSYPITLRAESVDMSGLIKSFMENSSRENKEERPDDRVYASAVLKNLINSLNSVNTQKNNLFEFKKFIESSDELTKYTSAIQYAYNIDLNVYTKNKDGTIIKSDGMELINSLMSSAYGDGAASLITQSGYSRSSTYNIWEELLSGEDSTLINPILFEQYDIIYGEWPSGYEDIMLVVNSDNEISDIVLYALGLKDKEELKSEFESAMEHEQLDTDTVESWSFEEICQREFKLILSADMWQKAGDGRYVNISETETGLKYLYESEKAIPLRISGIIRPNENAPANMLNASLAYTDALTARIIELSEANELIRAQIDDPETDALSGLKFKTDNDPMPDDVSIKESVDKYLQNADNGKKAEIYIALSSVPSDEYLKQAVAQYTVGMTRDDIASAISAAYAEQMGGVDVASVEEYISSMSDEELYSSFSEMIKMKLSTDYAEKVRESMSSLSADQLAKMLDGTELDAGQYLTVYENFLPSTVSDSDYEKNMKLLGYIDKDNPAGINIYASSFEDKDGISKVISKYNEDASEEKKITYTDYVALMMSSISTIINAISYVLIAFVAISLVVSSIMIGVITYISVLERTKEIGILRAIGASKKDISRVFNAETLIVGFISGAMGILITLLLLIPINIILNALTGIAILKALLPTQSVLILVSISMFLTFISGLIPSSLAAKKNPVIALRTE